MKDDPERVPLSSMNAAHAVPELDPIAATGALDGAVMNREHEAIALLQRQHHRPGLHARPLLGHHELTAREVSPWLRQQNGKLEREHVLAVEVLVKAIEVPLAVLENQRRRSQLPGRVARSRHR